MTVPSECIPTLSVARAGVTCCRLFFYIQNASDGTRTVRGEKSLAPFYSHFAPFSVTSPFPTKRALTVEVAPLGLGM